jgi:hypothetical protein
VLGGIGQFFEGLGSHREAIEAGSTTTSCPPTLARPRSASSRVARMRTRVVLPDPFGPNRAKIDPSATLNATPSRARVEGLRDVDDLDRGGRSCGRGFRLSS